MWSDRTPRARGEQIWVVNSTLLNSQHKSHNVLQHIMGRHRRVALGQPLARCAPFTSWPFYLAAPVRRHLRRESRSMALGHPVELAHCRC